jgi:hypothetical protein
VIAGIARKRGDAEQSVRRDIRSSEKPGTLRLRGNMAAEEEELKAKGQEPSAESCLVTITVTQSRLLPNTKY